MSEAVEEPCLLATTSSTAAAAQGSASTESTWDERDISRLQAHLVSPTIPPKEGTQFPLDVQATTTSTG